MKYCEQCGQKLLVVAQVCTRCGRMQPRETAKPTSAPTTPAPNGDDLFGDSQCAIAETRRHEGYVLKHSVPEIASYYRHAATTGAYALPETLSIDLVTTWIADTRGESFEIGQTSYEFNKAYQSFQIWLKEALEGAARQGGIELPESKCESLTWLLYVNSSVNLRGAIERYCDRLRRGSSDIAKPDQIATAWAWLKKEIQSWLTRNSIDFYKEPLTILPVTRLQRALAQFAGNTDTHFSPNIPQDKLANASETCGLPLNETIGILVDCTFWGSAKDCVLFGTRGIYYHNTPFEGFVPYCDFANRTFNYTENGSEVSLGKGERLSLSGSEVPDWGLNRHARTGPEGSAWREKSYEYRLRAGRNCRHEGIKSTAYGGCCQRPSES